MGKIIFIVHLFFMLVITPVWAKQNPLEGFQKLSGPYKELAGYCKQNPPQDSMREVCNPDIARLTFFDKTFKKPFLRGAFFETGDDVTKFCSLGLKTNAGWFVMRDVIECDSGAATARVNVTVEKMVLKKNLRLTFMLINTHTEDGINWIKDSTEKMMLTCRVDEANTVYCN
ncbi:hypothetical protein K1X76_12460 [bacterium]|nr:hypothetical protein [bacterium]